VNVPLPPSAGDDLFLKAFEEVVEPVVKEFAPDILVTQLGVDTFETDPITHLRLTTNGFEKAVSRFREMNLPWVALGGGGYDIGNVARAWTLAWAIMNDVTAPDIIPEDFMRRKGGIFRNSLLRDEPIVQEVTPEELRDFESAVAYIRKTILPLIRKGG
jgi:acetoin utilization protein AcuC